MMLDKRKLNSILELKDSMKESEGGLMQAIERQCVDCVRAVVVAVLFVDDPLARWHGPSFFDPLVAPTSLLFLLQVPLLPPNWVDMTNSSTIIAEFHPTYLRRLRRYLMLWCRTCLTCVPLHGKDRGHGDDDQ